MAVVLVNDAVAKGNDHLADFGDQHVVCLCCWAVQVPASHRDRQLGTISASEPLAITRKFAESRDVARACPSAIFDGTEIAARIS